MLFDGAAAATVTDAAQPEAAKAPTDAPTDSHTTDSHDATPPAATADQRHEIVFIDSQVQNYQQLADGLKPGSEVVLIDGSKDGLQQIADYLQGRQDIDAIHVLSHGSAGTLHLGSLTLNTGNLEQHSQLLSEVGNALSNDGDILLYGCDIAADQSGRDLLDGLARATRADVSASSDATGSSARGGDWELEQSVGAIEARALQPEADTLLALPNGMQDVTSSTTPGNFIPGFTLSTNNAVGTDTPGGLYLNVSGNPGFVGHFTVSADNSTVGTFDLTAIGFSKFNGFGSYSFTITGYKADGSTVTTSFTKDTSAGAFSQGTYTSFTGITKFDIQFQNAESMYGVANILFDSFSIANAAAPIPSTITSATYDASTGVLQGVGTNLFTGNSIDVSRLTLSGEGGATYTLTSANVTLTSDSAFSITLNATDRAAINLIFNKNGTSSTGGTAFNLFASDNWNASRYSPADSSNAITTSNVAAPSITSATYDATTGTLVVSGSNLVMRSGASNDIVASKLSIVGQGGSPYTLTSSNVEITSGTSFTITLNATDKTAIGLLLNKNGGSSIGGTAYNLAAAEDWAAGADAAVTVADLTGNGITVSNVINSAPMIANLNGESVAWAGPGNTVTLDNGGNASLTDAELGALNGGNGDWNGASLTVQRSTAVPADILGFASSGLFTVSGTSASGNLQSDGQTFATYTNSGGVLTVIFTSSATAATTALVNDVARHITYRNDTPAGDANMRFTLSDGTSSTTANITVTSDSIYVTNTSDTATINASDGVGLREAIAIAANDATGGQTIIFSSNLANQTLNLGSGLSLGESLTFNADAAAGLTITGSTITLGGGTFQTVTHASGTVTLGSTLAGSGTLLKQGAGTLALTSTDNEANMSGGIRAFNGTLQISDDDNLSSGTLVLSGGTLSNNNASFTVDNAINLGIGGIIDVGGTAATQLTLSGIISGSDGGTLLKFGQGILQLDGNNTYTDGTSVMAGTLILGHANALGTTAGSTMVWNGATLRVAGGLTVAENLLVNGTGTQVSSVNYGAIHLVSGSSTLSGTVMLSSDANISAASGSTLTISGALSGTSSLNKTDSGTLVLSNSGNEAGFTGGTTVTGGTLSISNDDQLGSGLITLDGGTLGISGATTVDNAIWLTSASTISNGATATLSGSLGGGGSLTKTGASTLTLSGNNTHVGSVNLTAGGLTLTGGSAIGNNSALTLSASTTLTVSTTEFIGSLAGTGSVVLNAGLTTGGNNTSTTFSGVISGSGNGITKTGSGTFTLSGANTYTGSTSVSAGTLTLNGGAAISDSSATIVASGATLSLSASESLGSLAGSGNVILGSSTLTSGGDNNSTTFSGALSGTGGFTKTGSGTLTLSGSNSGTFTGGITISGGGALSVASDDNLGSGTLSLNNGILTITGTTTIDNSVSLTSSATINNIAAAILSGAINGSGSLTKTGSSALTLSGTNTYGGATAVSVGTLSVTGALNGTSLVTVESGATLIGTGSVTNLTVNSGGTLAPGANGVGTLTVNGNLTMASGSTLAIDINGATAGTDYDQVVVNGAVDVSGATLAVNHGYTPGLGDTYTLINNNLADSVTGTFSGLAEGGTTTAGGNGTELTASYIGGTGNDLTLTAPIAPTVTAVSSSTANGTYKIGDTVTITVTFDTSVFVTGTPTLQLETGTTDRTLDFVSGSGTNTLTFSYTIQAGDSSADLDYFSSTALALNGGTIRDGSDTDAVLTLPTPGTAGSLGANKALVIDGIRPTAGIVVADTALTVGETTTVTITFNEAVTGLTTADFTVANGALSGLSSGDGGITWTATLTPAVNTEDASNLITLDNTGVTDLAGNAGSGSTDSNNYAIDTLRPTATVSVADTALAAGETTTVTITFNEAVSGLTTTDFTVANGTLSGLASGDGGITWIAILTTDTNVEDTSNLITLDNTGVADLAGNAGTGTTDSNNYAIDTLRPTASIVVADAALSAGETSTVTITFSEAVSGLTTTDFTVANGTLSGLASGDGGITWTATLTPDVNVDDTANLISLDNTGVADLAGNAGTGTTDSNNYAIDTLAPSVSSVAVPANGTYVAGQNLDFTVTFDDAVNVDTTGGTPRIAITLDTGGTVYADYLSGSGTGALVFRLTVANGQLDSNGIGLGSSIENNGGTLRDGVGNNVVTTLNSVAGTAGVQIDAVAPSAISLVPTGTSPTADTTLNFTLTFDEAVSGVDAGDFALITSGSAGGRVQSVVQLDARTYQVVVGNVTGQGSLGITLNAAGSGIVDSAGNALSGSFSGGSYTLGLLNDGDPQFKANPPPLPAPPAIAPLQPAVPELPLPPTNSPLLPTPLFEQRTLGSGLPSVSSIFIHNGATAPSFIAQVFASGAGDGFGDGSGAGFLGFGGGDGGVFGSSSLANIFDSNGFEDAAPLKAFNQRSGDIDQGLRGIFGAPSLTQQLQQIHETEQQPLRELAWALGQLAQAQTPS
ncbi:DUF4347 domain-containing protein [Pseudomonas sp. UL073]|uniref:DUF4347 domain-containing protein n=2 Tax=Zestomonas insulae TaxID=2809017 RepID=A0ABS2I956_9GAMM|nr:Ig-like domain-containing protein [Pseudomonas insulae]MBM7059659.1 DUF4347 domain-containing protein [Pseudomonas insulae]